MFGGGSRKPLKSNKIPITFLDQPNVEYGAPVPTAEFFSTKVEDLSVSRNDWTAV
jgi:hypothetical protein